MKSPTVRIQAAPPRRRLLAICAVVAIVALLTWAAVRWFGGKEKAPAAPPPIQATLVAAVQRDFAVYLAGVGTVQPNQSVTVKARVDGQLQKLGYTEGQDVRAGQVIAQIDPRPFQAQLAQVTATKARDEAQLTNARLDLARYDELIREQATSQQTLDTQKAQVAQLEAAVKTDEAQVSYARTQLDYTTITAPISGRTGLRLVDVGNIVHAADATGLVVIDQVDPINVVFTLPDAAFQQVNSAMRSRPEPLEVVAYERDSDRPLAKGRLVLIDNHIDTTSGTVQIKATFDNATHALWPGQYVNVHLYVAERPGAVLVPSAAVQRSQRGTFAWLVGADDKAQMQPIDVALIQDGQAVVTKGLMPGQRVAVDGQYKLKPGAKVVATSGPGQQGSGPTGAAVGADPAAASGNPAEKSAPENAK